MNTPTKFLSAGAVVLGLGVGTLWVWDPGTASAGAEVPSAAERAGSQPIRTDIFPNAPTGPGWLNVTPGDGWETAETGAWFGRGTERNGWILRNGNNESRLVTVQTIDDSPIGEGRALFHRYPIRHEGGGGPEPYFQDARVGARRIYVGFYAKTSPYFKGHPSGVIKLLYFYLRYPDNSMGRWWVEYRSPEESTPLVPFIVNRLKVDQGLRPNTGWSREPMRGEWALHELYLDLDAQTFWWQIDGEYAMHYGPGEWDATGVPPDAEWVGVNLSGILGGVGPVGNQLDQFLAYDRVQVLLAPAGSTEPDAETTR